MDSADSTLALWLARQARQLGLDTACAEGTDPKALQTFALVVLEELMARNLIDGEAEIGCWSRPRSPMN